MNTTSAPCTTSGRSVVKSQPSPADAPGHQLFEAGLVDRHPPLSELRDAFLVLVHARHPMPDVRQARARNEPHVSGAYDPDVKLFSQRHLSKPTDFPGRSQTNDPEIYTPYPYSLLKRSPGDGDAAG